MQVVCRCAGERAHNAGELAGERAGERAGTEGTAAVTINSKIILLYKLAEICSSSFKESIG
jgi:hypothetical protein